MTFPVSAAITWAGMSAHREPARPLQQSPATQDDRSSGTPCNMPHPPRRMAAVTVALSEPLDAPPIDWAETVAAVLRLTYANTTVEVIDSWSPSDLASFGLEQSERVDA